jgi:hypothetical protein
MEDTMMYERLSNPQQTCKTNDRKKQFGISGCKSICNPKICRKGVRHRRGKILTKKEG